MKQIAVNLIEEAVDAGARRHQACDILGISCRTLLRWQAAGDDLSDKRRQTTNRNYTHALTQAVFVKVVVTVLALTLLVVRLSLSPGLASLAQPAHNF